MHIYNLYLYIKIMTYQAKRVPRRGSRHSIVGAGFRAGLTEKMEVCFQHGLEGHADQGTGV